MKIELDVRYVLGADRPIDPHKIIWPDKVLTFTGPHAHPSARFAEALVRIHDTRRWMARLDHVTDDGIVVYKVPRVAFWRKPASWSADIRRDHTQRLRLIGIHAIPGLKAGKGPAVIH